VSASACGQVVAVRGGIEESRHAVHAAVCDAGGRLLGSVGDPDRLTVLRSSAKPWQAQVLVQSGALERFGLTDRAVAVACASHRGLPEHAAEVRAALEAAGVPLRLVGPTLGPLRRRLAHNCSGNHMGFLVASAARGWPLEGYREPGHPSQRAALAAVAAGAGVGPQAVATCTDGCGVVAFALPLRAIAGMFARVGAQLPAQAAAMRAHPQLVAGDGAFDTELMRALEGCVAKSGAEGVQGVGLAGEIGVAVRVEDGAGRAVAPAMMAVLDGIGAAREAAQLDRFRRPEIANGRNQVVGILVPDVDISI
jgi:L-asparaginase